MPRTTVLFYRDRNRVPVLEWFDAVDEATQDEALVTLALLEEFGYTLTATHAKNLGRGIYELRLRVGKVQSRILFFFHGQGVVVLGCAFEKEGKIPPGWIDTAADYKRAFEQSPEEHSAEVEL
jgi:phage-related protein